VNDEVMRNIDVEPRRQHLQPAATAAVKFYTQRLRNSIFSLLMIALLGRIVMRSIG